MVAFSGVGNSRGGGGGGQRVIQNIFSEVLIDFGKEVCTPPRNLSIIDHKETMATCTFYKNALHVSSKKKT